jgi:hypothetical protein
VAVWLDDLSRELLASGELQSLITGRHGGNGCAGPPPASAAEVRAAAPSVAVRVFARVNLVFCIVLS